MISGHKIPTCITISYKTGTTKGMAIAVTPFISFYR